MCKRVIELLPAYPPQPQSEADAQHELAAAWHHLECCAECQQLVSKRVDAETTRRFMLKDVSSPGTYVRMMHIFREHGVGKLLGMEHLEVLAIQHTRHGRKLVT